MAIDIGSVEKVSELTNEQKTLVVVKCVEEIKNSKQQVINSFLTIGRCLDLVESEKLYSFYGEHLETFNDFLREIRLGRATAYNCMRIWREFGKVLLSKNLDIDYFRLVRLLPILKEETKEEVREDWLYKAQDLDVKGFDDEIREAKGQIPQDTCNHSGEKTYFQRCSICGKLEKANIEEILRKYGRTSKQV